jgi:hypothetical protein
VADILAQRNVPFVFVTGYGQMHRRPNMPSNRASANLSGWQNCSPRYRISSRLRLQDTRREFASGVGQRSAFRRRHGPPSFGQDHHNGCLASAAVRGGMRSLSALHANYETNFWFRTSKRPRPRTGR